VNRSRGVEDGRGRAGGIEPQARGKMQVGQPLGKAPAPEIPRGGRVGRGLQVKGDCEAPLPPNISQSPPPPPKQNTPNHLT
jgi:hypothetical protein